VARNAAPRDLHVTGTARLPADPAHYPPSRRLAVPVTRADRLIADAVTAVIAAAALDALPAAIEAAAARATAATDSTDTPREAAATVVAAILSALPAAVDTASRTAVRELRRDGWHITALPTPLTHGENR
jgi:hypothetical protein